MTDYSDTSEQTAPEGDAPDAADDAASANAAPSLHGESDTDAMIATLSAQLNEQRDKHLRLLAEYDNYRKRTVRERQEAELKGMGLLIRGILDALDDLGRFAHLDPDQVEAAAVVQGAEMVEKKLFKSLAGHGLEIVNPVDVPFDPAVHEALTTMPAGSPDEDQFVGMVYQVGYLFNGQLLRAARVVVKQWSAPADADVE